MSDITFKPRKTYMIIGAILFGGFVYYCMSLYGGYGEMFSAAFEGYTFAKAGVILSPMPFLCLASMIFPPTHMTISEYGIRPTELYAKKSIIPWSAIKSYEVIPNYLIIHTVTGPVRLTMPPSMNRKKIIATIQTYMTRSPQSPTASASPTRLFGRA